MTSSNSKLSANSSPPATAYYHPLPPEPPPGQYVFVLPYSPRPRSTFSLLYRSCRSYCLCLTLLLLLSAAVFLLYPSDPEISIVRLHVDRLQFHALPTISLDITLDLTVKLFNRDLYSIDYKYLNVSISYRGKQLGYVTSDDGHVKARASSYINATLQLDGVEVFGDVIPLIEDWAKGSVTFDTQTEIGGLIGLGFFEIPLKATVSCELVVDTRNQTVSRQNCYPG